MRGTIARLTDRGFGFISEDFERHEYFFHASGLVGGQEFEDLAQGDRVEFEIEPSDRGPRATAVRVVA